MPQISAFSVFVYLGVELLRHVVDLLLLNIYVVYMYINMYTYTYIHTYICFGLGGAPGLLLVLSSEVIPEQAQVDHLECEG